VDHDNGNSAIFYSIQAGFLNSTKHLIKFNANVNLRNNKGETPVHYAVQRVLPTELDFLLEKGADIHALTDESVSPIQLAKPLAAAKLLKAAKDKIIADSNGSIKPEDITLLEAFPELKDVLSMEETITFATQLLSSSKDASKLLFKYRSELVDLEKTLEEFLKSERKNIPSRLRRDLTMSTLGPEKLQHYLNTFKNSTSIEFGKELWAGEPLSKPVVDPSLPRFSKLDLGPPNALTMDEAIELSTVGDFYVPFYEGYPLGIAPSLFRSVRLL
jgi:hypothetical protein